jgi:hypothetical protein
MSAAQLLERPGAGDVVKCAASVLDKIEGSSLQLSEAMLMMDTSPVSPSPLGFVGYGSRDDTR